MTSVSQEPPRCHASVSITPVMCKHLTQAKWENSDLTISSKLKISNKQMTWSVYNIVCLLADDIRKFFSIYLQIHTSIFIHMQEKQLVIKEGHGEKYQTVSRYTLEDPRVQKQPFHQCLRCWILCLSAQRRFDLLRKRDPGVTRWAVIKLKRSDTGGVVWSGVRAGFRCQSVTSESQQQGCNISGIGRVKITLTVTSSLSYWPLFPSTLFHLTPRVSFWHRGHHPKPLISI